MFSRLVIRWRRRWTSAFPSVPTPTAGSNPAWHLYTCRLNLDQLTCTRDEFIEALKNRYKPGTDAPTGDAATADALRSAFDTKSPAPLTLTWRFSTSLKSRTNRRAARRAAWILLRLPNEVDPLFRAWLAEHWRLPPLLHSAIRDHHDAKLRETGSGLGDALGSLGHELKLGYQRIRDALK